MKGFGFRSASSSVYKIADAVEREICTARCGGRKRRESCGEYCTPVLGAGGVEEPSRSEGC